MCGVTQDTSLPAHSPQPPICQEGMRDMHLQLLGTFEGSASEKEAEGGTVPSRATPQLSTWTPHRRGT